MIIPSVLPSLHRSAEGFPPILIDLFSALCAFLLAPNALTAMSRFIYSFLFSLDILRLFAALLWQKFLSKWFRLLNSQCDFCTYFCDIKICSLILVSSMVIPLIAQRSEPSSRTTLIGEQPNLWELLHPQDVVSRHRGAELRRRYELLGGTSLLSLE